ncbi:hypothetical protein Moror_9059 [Moniliophthora roreri MCA 2997]|uniref:Uncharacterized protein n=1 Tax=Moniliophthora roreri (strain MCA 2997) TaxID=1381753 RepID=V2X1A3_MONRO|nr:hypothetical protein Moror_9059 [Moniliophthora roreri MCA 2997]
MSELAKALQAGSALIDSSSESQTHLKGALLARLQRYYSIIEVPCPVDDSASLVDVQLQTAEQSLNIIEKVHKIIDSNDSPESAPLLGVRDLGRLRTLLSIIVRWGLEPLLDRVISAWPERPNRATSDSIIDLTSTPEDYSRLSSFVLRLHALIFPSGLQGKPSQSLITETILQRHSKDILAPSIALGWLPKSMSSESMFPLDSVRPLTMRLLLMLPSSQTIASLGGVMSTRSSVAHIRKTCGYLLSRQLLRPDGVRGLFGAVFGEAEGEEVTLKQLEHVSQVLTAIPANMKGQNYFEDIVPKVVNIVHDDKRLAYKRASAFTLSRLLAGNDETPRTIILSTLHSPFLQPESNSTTTAATAVSTLSSLLANSDPSPELITSLLSPIVPPLYALLYHLESVKISDPTIREAVRDMLLTWSRVMTKSEAVAVLWFILNDQDGKLKVGLDGMIQKTEKFDENLSLFTPESLRQAEESGQLEAGANFLDLYPDPSHYASFIQLINRQDILSDIFVMLLEAYRESKLSNGDPIQVLKYLQVIMQLQATMSHSSSKLGGFQNSAQVLEFIRQVLDDSARGSGSSEKRRSKNVESDVSSLRVVDHPVAEEEGEDSDDDLEDSEKRDIDTEMTETALTILLSILEGNDTMSSKTTSILNDILLLLEPIVKSDAEGIRELAGEARMVLTARLAFQNAQPGGKADQTSPEEDSRTTYQHALKLLQDPILPVRAHGLLLLRQLVTSSSQGSKPLDPALVPAIQDIFMQSVQDNDSYIFLNAVQGLAALVDRFGASVLKHMVQNYTRGLTEMHGGDMTQQEVDIRLRVGEALAAVVRRCGSTLGTHGSDIVPSLLLVLRSRDSPTTLKTSSLSLLAECQRTYPLVLLPYFVDLSEGILDLLQVETSRSSDTEAVMDDQPTSKNTKFPPLRRAALHFLSLLLKGTTEQIYDSSFGKEVFSKELIQRAKIILSYVSDTDVDTVVKVMGREALEQLAQLERAMIDL